VYGAPLSEMVLLTVCGSPPKSRFHSASLMTAKLPAPRRSSKDSTALRGLAEQVKIIRRDLRPLKLLGGIDAGEVDRKEAVGEDVVGDIGHLAPHVVSALRGAHKSVTRFVVAPEEDDAVGIGRGDGLQEHGVNYREDSGVDSDPEGQGGDRG
jgi:hypothetical protein